MCVSKIYYSLPALSGNMLVVLAALSCSAYKKHTHPNETIR
jgi:hypothetical protein